MICNHSFSYLSADLVLFYISFFKIIYNSQNLHNKFPFILRLFSFVASPISMLSYLQSTLLKIIVQGIKDLQLSEKIISLKITVIYSSVEQKTEAPEDFPANA